MRLGPDGEAAANAAIDLVRRTGAKQFEVGYLHDGVPAEEACWYAHAQYRGARIAVEHQPGPVEACDALARRLLTGAKCTHCHAAVMLADLEAVPTNEVTLIDGSSFRPAEQSACRWSRRGSRWVRGCREVGRG